MPRMHSGYGRSSAGESNTDREGGTAGLKSPWLGLRLSTVFSGDRYVERMVELFYKSDRDVKDDPELQVWCREFTEIGLLGAQD